MVGQAGAGVGVSGIGVGAQQLPAGGPSFVFGLGPASCGNINIYFWVQQRYDLKKQ